MVTSCIALGSILELLHAQIGTESLADFKTLVFQNIRIVDSHRGMAIQLRDGGAIDDVLFSNITLTTRQYTGRDWLAEWGEAEPIYVTALPRNAQTKVSCCYHRSELWLFLMQSHAPWSLSSSGLRAGVALASTAAGLRSAFFNNGSTEGDVPIPPAQRVGNDVRTSGTLHDYT